MQYVWISALRPRLSGALNAMQVQCGVDDTNMAECLREIPQHAFVRRVVLLGQQSDIIAQGGKMFVQGLGIIMPALQYIDVCQPKGTHQKSPLTRRQSINAGFGSEAHQQTITRQAVLDGGDGSYTARIVRRQETGQRDLQQAGVQAFASVVLHEAPKLFVIGFFANLFMDLVGNTATISRKL